MTVTFYGGLCVAALLLTLFTWRNIRIAARARKAAQRPRYRRIAAQRHTAPTHMFFVRKGLWQPRLMPRGENSPMLRTFNLCSACPPQGYVLFTRAAPRRLRVIETDDLPHAA